MAEQYKASIRVISQKGTCEQGHRVGEQWDVTGYETPPGICLAAFNALFPFLHTLMFGGVFPWEADPDVTTVACPDADNPVIFEIRRWHD